MRAIRFDIAGLLIVAVAAAVLFFAAGHTRMVRDVMEMQKQSAAFEIQAMGERLAAQQKIVLGMIGRSNQ